MPRRSQRIHAAALKPANLVLRAAAEAWLACRDADDPAARLRERIRIDVHALRDDALGVLAELDDLAPISHPAAAVPVRLARDERARRLSCQPA